MVLFCSHCHRFFTPGQDWYDTRTKTEILPNGDEARVARTSVFDFCSDEHEKEGLRALTEKGAT